MKPRGRGLACEAACSAALTGEWATASQVAARVADLGFSLSMVRVVLLDMASRHVIAMQASPPMHRMQFRLSAKEKA